MKKIFVIAILIMVACIMLTGCKYSGNRTLVDTTYKFDRGIVFAPNGDKIAEGIVENWHDYGDSDRLRVRINGQTYLTAAENIVLISGE